MIYKDLTFPKLSNRPYCYSNFVSTVDGKVQVLKNTQGYWPIGSKKDWETFIYLRRCSDVLIHGYNTAVGFRTVDTLRKEKLNKLLYIVLSNHPDKKLISTFSSSQGVKTMLVTSESAKVPKELEETVSVTRLGNKEIDLKKLSLYLFKQGYKKVLVEGGPNVMGSFLKENLIDEVFLTIAPKIFGSKQNQTLTMVEGVLFNSDKIKKLKLISSTVHNSEIYLRYKVLA